MQDEMKRINDLMLREEVLLPDLRPYLRDGPAGSKMIHSPWIIEMFFDPKHAALVNERYRVKKSIIVKALEDHDWLRALVMTERPYRVGTLEACLGLGLRGEAEKLYEAASYVWNDSENIWQHHKFWLDLWLSLPDPRLMMDQEERDALSTMSDNLTVYRGIRNPRHNPRGMSWTVDREKAVWFARRFASKKSKPTLISGLAKKSDVLSYFTDRGESEVVLLPQHVRERTMRGV